MSHQISEQAERARRSAAALGVMLIILCLSVLAVLRLNTPDPEPIEAPARWVVDLNAAQTDELQLLPRIGPALAQRIIDSRESDGDFGELNDLRRVHGIGPRTVEELRGFARTGP